jgi:Rrf2 family cysteine metabolism transcriptional repressor
MNFSIRVQYGVQALLELARKYNASPVQIGEIARSQRIPVRYLEQLLLVMKRRHLLSSVRGKEGGYSLAKHPGDISVLDIIEALDGPIELLRKKQRKSPVVHELFDNLQISIRNHLGEVSLEDLMFKMGQRQRTLSYHI